jgi:hypothetical protein
MTIRGYFQSWRTVQAAYDLGAPRHLYLRESSTWLSEALGEAQSTRPIAVHVRRGDYAASDSFGVLSRGYYELALRTLRTRGVDGPIWVFSDDPEAAGKAVPDWSRTMTSPSGPQEELILMSNAAAVVTANSSFSWWAAWLSGSHHVVAPATWFKSAEEPEGLIPPWWTRIASTWG